MPIIENAITPSDQARELIAIEVDRHSLQKCRWRRAAEDGTDFAFSLREPLGDGDFVYETATKRYQVCQLPEPVLTIPLPKDAAETTRLGWAIGNLHQPVDVREDLLLVGDDPTVRRLLTEMAFPFETSVEIFNPPAHSAMNHHTHDPGLDYDHQHFFFGHSPASPF